MVAIKLKHMNMVAGVVVLLMMAAVFAWLSPSEDLLVLVGGPAGQSVAGEDHRGSVAHH